MSEEEKKAIEDLKEEIKGAEYEGHGKDRIIIELKTILNLIEKQEDKIKLLENEESSYIAGYEDGKHHKMTATAIQVENQREYLINEQIKVYKERIENQQKELNNLKEIEKSHKEENGKLRVELEQEKEKNNALEKHQKQYLDGELLTAKQGKFFEKMIKENYIRKDKIKEMMKYREFELQQEYKEFEEDVEWRTYKKILEDK